MKVDFLVAESISNAKSIYGILRYTLEVARRQGKYGVQLQEISYPKVRPRLLSYILLLFAYPFVILLSLKARTVHLSSQTHAFLLLLPIFGSRKTVVTVYDIYPYTQMRQYSFINRLLTRLNMAGLKKADRLVAISAFTKNELVGRLSIPANKVTVIYPAVDHSVFKPVSQGELHALRKAFPQLRKNAILYVGSEEPRQSLETLLKALSILQARGMHFQFVKAGSPAWPGGREAFLGMLRKRKLEERTLLLDYVPEELMPALYSNSVALAYPCRYAGFGLPPIEAMACGCPIVTSNSSSLPEVVGGAGIMLPPDDAEGFADALQNLLRKPALRKKYSILGRKQARRFSWDKSARQFSSLYKGMI